MERNRELELENVIVALPSTISRGVESLQMLENCFAVVGEIVPAPLPRFRTLVCDSSAHSYRHKFLRTSDVPKLHTGWRAYMSRRCCRVLEDEAARTSLQSDFLAHTTKSFFSGKTRKRFLAVQCPDLRRFCSFQWLLSQVISIFSRVLILNLKTNFRELPRDELQRDSIEVSDSALEVLEVLNHLFAPRVTPHQNFVVAVRANFWNQHSPRHKRLAILLLRNILLLHTFSQPPFIFTQH